MVTTTILEAAFPPPAKAGGFHAENLMKPILILASFLPRVEGSAEEIRAYHLLRELSTQNSIYLAIILPHGLSKQEAASDLRVLKAFCEKIVAIEKPLIRQNVLSLVSAWLHQEPITPKLYYSADMKKWVQFVCHKHQIKQTLALSAVMAQYLFCQLPKGAQRLVDFGQPYSKIWADRQKHYPFAESFCKNESQKMQRFEAAVANFVNTSFFAHQKMAVDFVKLSGIQKPVLALPSGVDLQAFNPIKTFAPPFGVELKVILFKGATRDESIEAGLWFARILPLLRMQEPNACCMILGAEPPSEIPELAWVEGLAWISEPKDVRPYLQHAKVVVNPIKNPEGLSTFMLQAMAMAKPILSSPGGVKGIPDNESLAIWTGLRLEYWVKVLLALLSQNNAAQCASNREWVSVYDWTNAFSPLKSLLEEST